MSPPLVFDRAAVRRHRDRAAPMLVAHDFLQAEAAERLVERLDEVLRPFERGLVIGGMGGALEGALAARGIVPLAVTELSPAMARRGARTGGAAMVTADEERLPFAAGAFDLILGGLSLHWVNDLPGSLVQIRRLLRPDGLFLAVMLGGDTLLELRRALAEAEMARSGGMSPRVSPMVDTRTAGDLLARAGFALPMADSDRVTVTYPDAFRLMHDLRGMGETNAVAERRRHFTGRRVLLAAAERYQQATANADGFIPATFELIFLTGWSPDPSQPKPLRPGSATARLADVLKPPPKV